MAALFHSDFADGNSAQREEWEKLVKGVKNNQPEIVAKWRPPSRNQLRKILRLAYGTEAVRVLASANGIIDSIAVAPGQVVRAGQRLGVITTGAAA